MANQKKHIFICTHGRFGEELIRSAEMIVGKLEDVHSFSLLPGMALEEFSNIVEDELKTIEGEFIALVDLFGGTPCTTMAMLSQNYPVQILTGLNLAMLIELYSQKDNYELEELLEIGIRTVNDSCKDVLKVLKRK